MCAGAFNFVCARAFARSIVVTGALMRVKMFVFVCLPELVRGRVFEYLCAYVCVYV